MKKENINPIVINPKNDNTVWVALDSKNNIIGEGPNPKEALENAKGYNNPFLMWVGKKGVKYIF